jgi:AcrR family transcriptional regulator
MSKHRGQKTKEAILRVAGKLFAANGFDHTSVDQIARAARVNKALIYYHFQDKDDLVASLFSLILQELTARAPTPAAAAQLWTTHGAEILSRPIVVII